jgi:hypothetical protein
MEADDGVSYENDVNAEVGALWAVGAEWAASVGGTANAITATSDSGVVGAALAIGRPKSYWLVPTANNTSSVTISPDGLGPYAVVDKDGNALPPNALLAGRITQLVFDGAQFRVAISNGGSGTPAAVNAVNNGRLTLASGVFVPSSNILAATTLYWTIGGLGNQIGLYDGISSWINVASTEKSVKLTDTQTGTTSNGSKIITGLTDTSQFVVGMKASGTGVGAGAVINTIDSGTQVTLSVNSTAGASVSITFKLPANSVFDVFGVLTSGALKLHLWPWTNSTTRSFALAQQDGIYILTGNPTWRYLGTIATAAVDGQSEFSYGGSGAGGVASNMLVCNQYNRVPMRANIVDTTASYAYSGAARSVDGSNAMRVTFVLCQAEDSVVATYQDIVQYNSSGTVAYVGLALDATNVFSGSPGMTASLTPVELVAKYVGRPTAGLHFLQANEQSSAGSNIAFFHVGTSFSSSNGDLLAADLSM